MPQAEIGRRLLLAGLVGVTASAALGAPALDAEKASRPMRTFHVIAPDYPGFGYGDAPPPEQFAYISRWRHISGRWPR